LLLAAQVSQGHASVGLESNQRAIPSAAARLDKLDRDFVDTVHDSFVNNAKATLAQAALLALAVAAYGDVAGAQHQAAQVAWHMGHKGGPGAVLR
jgi:hypothetical protein